MTAQKVVGPHLIVVSVIPDRRESTEKTEITEKTEKNWKIFRLFRYFRLFRTLSFPWLSVKLSKRSAQ